LDDYSSNLNKGVKRKLKDDSGQIIDKVVFEWFAQHPQYLMQMKLTSFITS